MADFTSKNGVLGHVIGLAGGREVFIPLASSGLPADVSPAEMFDDQHSYHDHLMSIALGNGPLWHPTPKEIAHEQAAPQPAGLEPVHAAESAGVPGTPGEEPGLPDAEGPAMKSIPAKAPKRPKRGTQKPVKFPGLGAAKRKKPY